MIASISKNQKLSTAGQISSYKKQLNQILKDLPLQAYLDSIFNQEFLDDKNNCFLCLIEFLNDETHCYFSISQIKTDIDEAIQNCALKFTDNKIKSKFQLLQETISQYLDFFNQPMVDSLCSLWKKLKKHLKHLPSMNGTEHNQKIVRHYTKEIQEMEIGHEDFSISEIYTDKKSICDGINCSRFESLYNNTCYAQNFECSFNCGCSETNCFNREVSKRNENYVCGINLSERPSFGFDKRSAMMLCYILVNTKKAKLFISKSLLNTINWIGFNYNKDLIHCLSTIIKVNDFNVEEKNFAKTLLNAIYSLGTIFGIENILKEFIVYQKGFGIFNNGPESISKNAFLAEYIGQIFNPAQFYEKDMIIKQIVKSIYGETQPFKNFYNVELEREADDMKGYEIFLIDSSVKGNWVPKINHSCKPNCELRTIISCGQYKMALYAIDNINPREELCWNYGSYTEIEEEHKNSICLCSQSNCNGFYLYLNNAETGQVHFSGSFYILCLLWQTEYSSSMEDYIRQYNLNTSLLFNCPEWLKCWVYFTLKNIEALCGYKKEKLKEMGSTDIDEEVQKFYCVLRKELMITMNKIKYIIQNIDDHLHSPIYILDDDEILDYLWGNKDFSIKSRLKAIFKGDKNISVENLLRKENKNYTPIDEAEIDIWISLIILGLLKISMLD